MCGITHLMSLYNMVIPEYYSSGIVKLITAGVSIYTAYALIKIMPELIRVHFLGIRKDNILEEYKSLSDNLDSLYDVVSKAKNKELEELFEKITSSVKGIEK